MPKLIVDCLKDCTLNEVSLDKNLVKLSRVWFHLVALVAEYLIGLAVECWGDVNLFNATPQNMTANHGFVMVAEHIDSLQSCDVMPELYTSLLTFGPKITSLVAP